MYSLKSADLINGITRFLAQADMFCAADVKEAARALNDMAKKEPDESKAHMLRVFAAYLIEKTS